MMKKIILLTVIVLNPVASLVYAQVCKKKDIAYKDRSASGFNNKRNRLDIYYPKDTSAKKDVFVFIHGGSWRSGRKDTYGFLGRNMAKKGFVAVIINYRLSLDVKYDLMAQDCDDAITWIYNNIDQYGGDRNKITVAGHSAGGHLAAYISLADTSNRNKITKTILIDPFGLDMFTYFKEYNNDYARSLFKTFTNNPTVWKAASPISYIGNNTRIPFLVMRGSKTYKTISESCSLFKNVMDEHGAHCEYTVIKNKKHIGMITQLLFPSNKTYKIIVDFLKR